MTRLLVLNPNTSTAMTRAIEAAAELAAAGRAEVLAVQPALGPESIEGEFDEVVSAYHSLDAVVQTRGASDFVIVACYSVHPVIGALREALAQPVIGIMEASIASALPLGARFAIVTTSPRWQPLLVEGVRSLGFADRCASVRSSGLSVLDLERRPAAEVRSRLLAAARAAVEEDGAEVICLGCAGMAGLHEAVSAGLDVPVVEAVAAGVGAALALAAQGLQTAKTGLYRPVDPRAATGLPAGIAHVYGAGAAAPPDR
ncbi:MAG: aspartate/glutamate racemase family protein [Candidatus Dormibacteraeota bacterium]|nr:aspartate/glutamate racemase family protein [Candidatus Dormibacteraeota bacterium]